MTQKDVFTVIGYRPNGVDTCRGCVMSTSDSDFFVECYQTKEEAANRIARAVLNAKDAKNLAYGEWEITVLVNGKDQYFAYDDDAEADTHIGFQSEIEILSARAVKKNLEEREAAEALKKEAEAKKAAEARLIRKAEADRKERETYEALKAKYEGGTSDVTP